MKSNIIGAASAGSPEPVSLPPPQPGAAVGRFYDALWQDGPSPGALAHGAAHIGQECLLSASEILALAQIAEIGPDTYVLDLGSGCGGPACYLAQQRGCRVLGLDLSGLGHARALARAAAQGLSQVVEFRQGDVHSLELPAASVDVILGLDAWCHIPQRTVMLQRCATWLRPGGRLAFYDQVERHPLLPHERALLCAQWHFPDLETPRSYIAAIKAAGLEVDFEVETSWNARRFYTALLEAWQHQRALLTSLHGPERYQTSLTRFDMMQRLADLGMIGQFGCIALKPSPRPRTRG
ncbi:MAG: cyclopropane-fatty-acyl-phospholipid synthase family protein [Candidatus Tectimicrobiota bacterium]